jgi:hypothetical protein
MSMYPEWKIVAWRFARVFVSVFLVQLGTGLVSIENPAEIWKALILPALSGAITALGKALRDNFAEKYPAITKLFF